jgi:hypothetical protein
MAGIKESQTKLNITLKHIVTLLHRYRIKRWFIAYGTLLGMARNGSCIDGDDDVDIVCDNRDYDRIRALLAENGMETTTEHDIGESRQIIKTVPCETYTSIDFYCAEVDVAGNFKDTWEDVIWSYCVDPRTRHLPRLRWQGTIIQVPHNTAAKLRGRYGSNWHMPQDTKGPQPRKKRL